MKRFHCTSTQPDASSPFEGRPTVFLFEEHLSKNDVKKKKPKNIGALGAVTPKLEERLH